MTLDKNKEVWGGYDWSKLGDEWSEAFGSPELQWTLSIYPRIAAYLKDKSSILEIATGCGRWTQFLLPHAADFTGIDIVFQCIATCRERFGQSNTKFRVTDGRTIPVPDHSIDFAFSYDSLVHADESVIADYLSQLALKLKPGAWAFIHHSNAGACENKIGERDPLMTAEKFANWCTRVGLACVKQELVNWSNDDLTDCFSVVQLGPPREPEVIRNPNFRLEMAAAKKRAANAPTEERPKRYVAIAEFSTFHAKQWLYPHGWQMVCDWLKGQGYEVASVTKEPTGLRGILKWNDKPIEETVRNIQNAALFIGVSSGPMWLAYALGVPTVVISGFTLSYSEMSDCYRVINNTVCTGCYNDISFPFDRGNWFYCPREKHFECSTTITPQMVMDAVKQVLSTDKTKTAVHQMPDEKFREEAAFEAECASIAVGSPPVFQGPQRTMMILPHCSTGGLPAYALAETKARLAAGERLMVVEWNYYGSDYVVQREQFQEICGFRSLGGSQKLAALEHLIEIFDPDTVYLQEYPEMFMDFDTGCWLYRQDHKYRILETTHDSNFHPSTKIWMPDEFAPVCRYHEELLKKTWPKMPVTLTPYKVAKHKTKPRFIACHQLALSPKKQHILNVGLWTPGKNQGEALEVAALLPEYQFHFVGNQAENFKEYWEPLRQRQLGLPNVHVWGERADVDHFYAAADALLFTSTAELAPLAVKEALAWGLPVLMRNLPIYLGEYDDNPLVHYIDGDVVKTAVVLKSVRDGTGT